MRTLMKTLFVAAVILTATCTSARAQSGGMYAMADSTFFQAWIANENIMSSTQYQVDIGQTIRIPAGWYYQVTAYRKSDNVMCGQTSVTPPALNDNGTPNNPDDDFYPIVHANMTAPGSQVATRIIVYVDLYAQNGDLFDEIAFELNIVP